MQAFGASISSGPLELRVRHLDALSTLFEQGSCSTSGFRLMVIEKFFMDFGK